MEMGTMEDALLQDHGAESGGTERETVAWDMIGV